MARALRPGTLGPTGTPTGTWQRGPGGLAPDDDGGGGLGPPVVAEVVLEVLLDEASLLVAHLGVGVLGGGEGEAAAREVEVDGRLSRPRLPHARPQRQLHAHVEFRRILAHVVWSLVVFVYARPPGVDAHVAARGRRARAVAS